MYICTCTRRLLHAIATPRVGLPCYVSFEVCCGLPCLNLILIRFTTPVLATYGHCSGSCDARANKALGIGSGWQQSRQNQAPRAVVVYYLSEVWLRPLVSAWHTTLFPTFFSQGCTCKADRNGHERACIRATSAHSSQCCAGRGRSIRASLGGADAFNKQQTDAPICRLQAPTPCARVGRAAFIGGKLVHEHRIPPHIAPVCHTALQPPSFTAPLARAGGPPPARTSCI